MSGSGLLARVPDAVGVQWSWVERVAAVAADRGHAVWMVGGAVRDLLLGRPVVDVDLVVEGDAIALADATVGRHGGSRVRHGAFGTAKWLPPGGGAALDLATARSETYDRVASLPLVERADIHADLQRRDFSINAMALGISQDVADRMLDPFGGSHDLAGGVLRVLHERSFEDDPTRGFRAARFAGRFGLTHEPQSAAWLTHALETGAFAALSLERLGVELERLLGEVEPIRGIRLLRDWGILDAWSPPPFHADAVAEGRLAQVPSLCARAAGWAPDTPFDSEVLDWMVLSDGLPREVRDARTRMVPGGRARQERFAAGLDAARAAVGMLRGTGRGAAGHVLRRLDPMTRIATLLVDDTATEGLVQWWFTEGRAVRLAVDGSALVGAGVPRGPAVGRALDAAWSAAWEGAGEEAQMAAALGASWPT